MYLGENLRCLRESRQISRQELADDLNLSYSSICKYECGSRTPDYDTLVKMARVFQVGIEELLGARSRENASDYPILDPTTDTAYEHFDIYPEPPQAKLFELSDEEAHIIKLYRGLDAKRKVAVRELLEPISIPEKPKARSKNKKSKSFPS